MKVGLVEDLVLRTKVGIKERRILGGGGGWRRKCKRRGG